MTFILGLIYLYILVYTVYMFVLALRNLKDSTFSKERKYSKFDSVKKNFALVVYTHNNKIGLEELIQEIKMQDYPLGNFKVYVILDNCNDGSEKLFEQDNFVYVLNIQDVGTLGKDKSISILLDKIKDDSNIDAYIFIDGTRKISGDFLTLANVVLERNDAVIGEININRENLDIIDRIKAVYKKYQANFFKQARTLCGLATTLDSGLFIIKKSIVDELEHVDVKDVNSALEFSLLLNRMGCKCVYNPNIQSFILGQDCTFKNPRLSKRLELVKDNFANLKTINFSFIEQVFSLLNPNFWTLVIGYAFLIFYSYNYQFPVTCRTVIFSAVLTVVAFALSLMNAKLNMKEIILLAFYPLYSMCHIIKNLPPIRWLLKKLGANTDADADKLILDVMVQTKYGDRSCRLEFISTESGLAKIRFIYKNKKYTTDSHFRMIDALQQLKTKMDDFGLTLKICSCCANFTSNVDGSTNMLKGQCHNDYPSPLIREPRPTLVWNSCSCFEPAKINSIIEELAREVENQKY